MLRFAQIYVALIQGRSCGDALPDLFAEENPELAVHAQHNKLNPRFGSSLQLVSGVPSAELPST